MASILKDFLASDDPSLMLQGSMTECEALQAELLALAGRVVIVLDEASGNCAACEGEFACDDEDHARFQAEQDRIDEVRRLLGVE